jgi:hypothetical protein
MKNAIVDTQELTTVEVNFKFTFYSTKFDQGNGPSISLRLLTGLAWSHQPSSSTGPQTPHGW